MTQPLHPDLALTEIIAVHGTRSNKIANLTAVHDVCKAMYERGERDFRLTVVANHTAANGLVGFSTVTGGVNRGYGAVVKAWQAYANGPEEDVDPNWPPNHPEVIFRRLLAAPKRREHKAAALRAVHQLCRERFARGERNFRPAVVGKEVAAQGIYKEGTISTGVKTGFGELLDGWQALADRQDVIQEESGQSPDRSANPDAVLQRLLQSRDEKTSQHRFYIGLHDICKARVDRGEYDLSRSAVADDLVEAGVFASDNTLVWKLENNPSYSELLTAWQEAANARWISADPSLAPTNPHRVYRRLAKTVQKADQQQRLLGLHRVCFLHQAAGIRRSQLLDSALYNEGLPPMFLKLTEAEQLSVGNAFVQRLSRIANPDSPFLGQRTVVEIIDAGAKLSESLGIDLVASLPELLGRRPAPKALGRGRDVELIEA